MRTIKPLFILMIVFFSGCASIPPESVALNKEIASGITALHESNVALVTQYFTVKKAEIDKYEKQTLENFFNKIASATTKPGAPPLDAHDLLKIQAEVEKIHELGSNYKEQLDSSKALVIAKLQSEYNLLITANVSITALLQSTVDVDKANKDGLTKAKEFSSGKIDLTNIDSKVNDYLAKMGSTSGKASDLVNDIQSLLNQH